MPVLKVFEHQTIKAGETLNFYKGKFYVPAKLEEKYIKYKHNMIHKKQHKKQGAVFIERKFIT